MEKDRVRTIIEGLQRIRRAVSPSVQDNTVPIDTIPQDQEISLWDSQVIGYNTPEAQIQRSNERKP